jgi:hypothetical protein
MIVESFSPDISKLGLKYFRTLTQHISMQGPQRGRPMNGQSHHL